MSGSNINLDLPDSFSEALKLLVPSVTEQTLILLEEFQSLLIQANTRVNLTRIENELEFKFKHIIDSALILYAVNLDLSQERLTKDLLDFGTGGGIPGVLRRLPRGEHRGRVPPGGGALPGGRAAVHRLQAAGRLAVSLA